MANTQFVTVVLYGKTYKVRCPAGHEAALHQAAQLLNQKIEKNRTNTGLSAREDLIMMTALNLCHDIIESQQQEQDQQQALENTQAAAMVRQSGNN